MMLDLSPIINYEGKTLPVEAELELSASEAGLVFFKPVKVSGQMTNIGGSIELSCDITAMLLCACDRCCGEFKDEFKCVLSETLRKESMKAESGENPDVIYFQGSQISLSELVLNTIIVSLPSKLLCKEDCRGLCPSCGADLNLGDCGCDTRPVDPRFDILDKLF